MFSKGILRASTAAARYLPARVKLAVYRYPNLARLIRKQLNLSLPQGVQQVEIAGGELRGAQMLLNLQEEKDYWLGTYEVDLQAAIKQLVNPGMVVYDVGANIGYITLLLAKQVGENGSVYAFEALPDNVARLEANIELNQSLAKVTVTSCAVVDRSREVTFMVGPSGGMGKAEGSAGRQDIEYEEMLTVHGISLDEFIFKDKNPHPEVVKMDIEGGEILALPGMKRSLAEDHPTILLELHGPESAKVAWDVFSKAGYQICHMQSGFPKVSSLGELDWKAYIAAFYK